MKFKTSYPNQLDEELLVWAGAQEEEQHHDHRQNDRDGTQREEELGRDHKSCNETHKRNHTLEKWPSLERRWLVKLVTGTAIIP